MRIKLGNKQPFPNYTTPGSAGFELCATESVLLGDKVHMMDLDIAVEIPEGYYGKPVVRSSMAKRGIMLAHGTGVIDSDYFKNIHAPLYSRSVGGSLIEKGERIVQLLICPVDHVDFEIVDSLKDNGRGGFGSTGEF